MATDEVAAQSVKQPHFSDSSFPVTCASDVISASSRGVEKRSNLNNNNSDGGNTKPNSDIRVEVIQEVESSDHSDNQSHQSLRRRQPPMPTTSAALPRDRQSSSTYDAFFVHHSNQRDWVYGVMERLESPSVGLRCLSVEQDARGSPLYSRIDAGVRRSRKTLMVLSPEFISDIWMNVSDMKTLAGGGGGGTQSMGAAGGTAPYPPREFVVLMFRRCDVPNALFDAAYVDAEADDWWLKLIAHLRRTDDTPQTELTVLSGCCSPDDNNDISLHNGRLLTSLRSQCRCCCREIVDASELPNEFLVCGVQIPVEEYSALIDHLMSDGNFLCHVWCYNVPGAVLFFTVLLGVCLGVIPFVEVRWLYRRSQAGLEFVHAVVVWLCCLAVYLIALHLSKRRMKRSSYKKLTHVNRCLVKYDLLAGIENLGLADCNKYYLHFFYYDVGPCLAYLQEAMVSNEEVASGAVVLGHSMSGLSGQLDGHLDSFSVEMETCDEQLSNKMDRLHVLSDNGITNASLQVKTAEMIVEHSGQYVSLLISKKLERPRNSRHIVDRQCLCQYIEQHVCRLTV